MAARNPSSGSVGTAHQWVEVPPFTPNHMALSSIFLSARPSPTETAESPGAGDSRLALDAVRRFRPSTLLAVVLQIYNPTRRTDSISPEVAVTMRLFRGNLLVVEAPPRAVDTPDDADPVRLSYGAALALKGLAPGIYSIEVAVTDRVAKSSAVERTHLTIQ